MNATGNERSPASTSAVGGTGVMNRIPGPDSDPGRFLRTLLEEERLFAETAVTRFSNREKPGETRGNAGPVYRDLIPLERPAPGEQYAFEVDLDRCSGCKACVTACHHLNGLDTGETWRSVGDLDGGTDLEPYRQAVTTACHHCVDPACLNGCPVLAYDKDPSTGIVRHLDDQCIGCQYCVLMCPYEVPQYNRERGIVRKCDMCHQRLEGGAAPACAQACPNEAIRITVIDRDAVAGSFGADDALVPTAPSSKLTAPSTRYVTERAWPEGTRAVNEAQTAARPGPAHWPLIWMLVWTQVGIGMILGTAFIAGPGSVARWTDGWALPLGSGAAWAALAVGMTASVLHLGRPLHAWRAFLGWRRSWLSREILAFGALFPIVALTFGFFLLARLFPDNRTTLSTIGFTAAALAGLTGVIACFCSAMIYHDTRRDVWRLGETLTRFLGTTLLTGAGGWWAVAACIARQDVHSHASGNEWILAGLPVLVLVIAVAKLSLEDQWLRPGGNQGSESRDRRSSLVAGRLKRIARSRFVAGCVGGVVLPMIAVLFSSISAGVGFGGAAATPVAAIAVIALLLMIGGEVMERYLFFRSAVIPRMPGEFGS